MKLDRRMEGRRAGDPAALIADNRAILDALAWRPARDDLDTIVTDALAWERKLGER
jgi:UDP-glucose 4-epimerase